MVQLQLYTAYRRYCAAHRPEVEGRGTGMLFYGPALSLCVLPGKLSVDIPWLSLYSEPVLVHVEDVLILAAPIGDEPYDADKERLLARARKSHMLELLEPTLAELDKPRGFVENFLGTIMNNVQVYLFSSAMLVLFAHT
ncbi:hypothetical protein HPB52_024072 [Rhipicephalus sanguineus]|uniref:Uncharacterized protein n=1 Tax=Rhipicephalus sanguineus TaxID=34632 RepID=A0A9D4PQ60_RHISA|nr:hypothetical protein HPB52_024072 [Rhipicephalus sanguineus]